MYIVVGVKFPRLYPPKLKNYLFEKIHTYNLAILFNPTASQRDNSTYHSHLLLHWVECVLVEYDLSKLGGADTRRLIDKCMKVGWKWSAAQLFNWGLVDAFGVDTHVSKSKNKDVRLITTT